MNNDFIRFITTVGWYSFGIRIYTADHPNQNTHSCRDLNPKTYLTIFAGICLMEVYAINLWLNGSGYMFLITNTVSLAIVYYICMLILMEQDKKIMKPLHPVEAFFYQSGMTAVCMYRPVRSIWRRRKYRRLLRFLISAEEICVGSA